MKYCKVTVGGTCLFPLVNDGDVLEVPNWDSVDFINISHNDILIYHVARLWIKLVIAVPGDYFEFIDGTVFINHKEILTPQHHSYEIQTKVLEGYSNSFILDGGCMTLSAHPSGSDGDSSRIGTIDFSNVRGLWRPAVDNII